MNRKAIISGREYALLEIVPSLDGGRALLLMRFLKSSRLWMEGGRCFSVKMKTAKGQYAPSRCGAAVR